MGVRFEEVTVELSNTDGNAFAILARVTIALKEAGASGSDILEFQNEATRGDYDQLLQTVFDWVNVI